MVSLRRTKSWNDGHTLLACLIGTCLLLIVLPVQFQSRYTQGLHPALVIFSATGVLVLVDAWAKRSSLFLNRYVGAVIWVLGLSLSNLFILTRDISYAFTPPPSIAPVLYQTNGFREVLNTLNAQPRGAVFAPPLLSLFVPVFTSQRAFVAHSIETTDYRSKLMYVPWFFGAPGLVEQKKAFLQRNAIDYVVVEASWRGASDAPLLGLEVIAQNADAVAYRVIQPAVAE